MEHPGGRAGTSDNARPASPTVAIIGSGAAASAAAVRASTAGARVTMIEAGEIGGTCVNTGCVPSKIMLRAAHIAHLQGHHPFHGLERLTPRIERSHLLRQQRARVATLRETRYREVLEEDPRITLVRARARFQDHRTLLLEDGSETRTLRADRTLIATGSRPVIPEIPGLRQTPYWTSEEALESDALPRQLVVIGAGPVALELGQAFRRLGTQVTLLARGTLLSREDPAIGEAMAEYLLREQFDVGLHTRVKHVHWRRGQFTVHTDAGAIQADRLLVATGRRPDTGALGLDRAGIETDERGAVMVNSKLKTSAPHIYAAGDCTTQPALVYVAAAAGTRAAINMTGGDAALNLDTVPWVIFTDPQVAAVGLDEHQAARAGMAAVSRTLPLGDVPRAIVNFDRRGFIKLIADRFSGRLIGARIVAASAGEIIQTAAVAVSNRMTTTELADGLFPYLTMAEGLKLCAQSFSTEVTRLPCCAG